MKTPFPITFRELWLPTQTRSTFVPSYRGDLSSLTLTGAQKGTTTDGVHFTGSATSNIVVTAAAGQNAKAAFYVAIRFRLPITYAAGAAGNFYLFRKFTGTSYIRVYLKAADGKLYWEQDNGAGGAGFSLVSTTASWTTNTWYTIICSLTDTPTQRMLVNGVAEATGVGAAVATPNGGDMTIGSSAAGATDGIVGDISIVCIGVGTTAVTALSTDEENNLYQGFPPPVAKVQTLLLLDEGRGTVATDRGSLAGNGTIGAACKWQYSQVMAPILSFDSLNDGAQSPAANTRIDGACTLFWVGKMKSTYNIPAGGEAVRRIFIYALPGNTTDYFGMRYDRGSNALATTRLGSNSGSSVTLTPKPAIDDYWIVVVPATPANIITAYLNGVSLGNGAQGGVPVSGLRSSFMGIDFDAPRWWDVSRPLMSGLIEGALTAAQAKTFSRWIRDRYNLPITIS